MADPTGDNERCDVQPRRRVRRPASQGGAGLASIAASPGRNRDHPFPPALAPTGYRIKSIEPMSDGEETLGWAVYFAGPDDQDSISYYPHAMAADGVYEYWKNATVGFAKAEGKEPRFLRVENLGSRSFCEEGDDVFHEEHRVSCIAAFDGMAIIADSVNRKPERGSLEHAVTLLRAGAEHWESTGD